MTASQFADLLQVHHNTIGAWLQAGMPATRAGRATRIEIGPAVRWVRDRDVAEHKAELAEVSARMDPAAMSQRKLAAEARLKELDVEEREGALISADEVEARWSQVAVAIREAVMAVPGMAVQIGILAATREVDLEALCRDTLTTLGRQGQVDDAA